MEYRECMLSLRHSFWSCYCPSVAGDYTQALSDVQACLQLDPRNVDSWYLQGVVHQEVSHVATQRLLRTWSCPYRIEALPAA